MDTLGVGSVNGGTGYPPRYPLRVRKVAPAQPARRTGSEEQDREETREKGQAARAAALQLRELKSKQLQQPAVKPSAEQLTPETHDHETAVAIHVTVGILAILFGSMILLHFLGAIFGGTK